MAYTEGTLGAMLQGVSQQPARLRAEGQVSEQINYDSDVSTGLTSRPGTDEIANLTGSTFNMRFDRIEYNGAELIVGYEAGVLSLWNTDGDAFTISYPDGLGYITDDMVFHPDTEAGHIKCLSRDTVVEMSGTVTGRTVFAATSVCLGGIFERTYKITVIASNDDEVTIEYTTPDGTNAGDAAKTAAAYIMEQLETAWAALSLPAGLSTATLQRSEDVLVWTDTTQITLVSSDGDSGDTIRVADAVVKDVTHLPDTSVHGHTVRVQGGASVDDDYFLRFVSDTTTTDGGGFGEGGVWREAADPDIDNQFDVSTMPYSLEIDTGALTATFAQLDWEPRRVGDENTNEVPSFVGHKIRDMVIFEGRLLVISSGGTVFASRNDKTTDMWRQSATTQAPDDPLDFRSTAVGGTTLDWVVPFDRDLLVVADPGSAQFVIRGGGLTPDNASMVLTTKYAVSAGVRPVSTGRTIILPFKTGRYVGINEFFTQDENAVNAADPLTAVQDKYISGVVNDLRTADNFSRFSLTADGDDNIIWVYRYLWDANQRLQSAWYKMRFVDAVRMHFYDESNMFVVLRPLDDTSAAVLVRMDMNRLDYGTIGFHITLDRKLELTVSDNKITTPYDGVLSVQGNGCTSPGLLALETGISSNGDGTYDVSLDAEMCPNGATVIAGRPVSRELEPTMPQPRNFQGSVVSNAVLALRHFLIHLSDSPDIRAVFSSPYRNSRDFYLRTVPVDNDPLDTQRRGKRDYVLKAPWREQTDKSTLTVTCDDIRPDTILEIEWAGDLRGVRRRV